MATPTRPLSAPGRRGIVSLFIITTFVASFLLFLVQPLFAKMVVPRLGGSPSVWNTCMLFFQAVLLAGYVYAHLTVRWLGTRTQAVLHVFVMALALAALPLDLSEHRPPPASGPEWWLLRIMAVNVGLPFFAVATMAPLVQRWFASLPVPSAEDPYFLYAASNTGSMLALLSFPFLLEPAVGVRTLAAAWAAGYVAVLALAGGCARTLWNHAATVVETRIDQHSAVTLRRRLEWVLLSFVPSSLMLGVTTHISTDLAAVPLLWIVPLSLYLATFIIAFGRTRAFVNYFARLLPPLALASIGSILLRIGSPYLIPLHVAAFFTCALVSHVTLAKSRPPAERLTEFYVLLSLGGMLGGIFNALIAPALFDGVYEYPLVLAAGCILCSTRATARPEPWPLFILTAAAAGVVSTGARYVDPALAGRNLSSLLVIALLVIGAVWSVLRRRTPFNAVVLLCALLVAANVGGLRGDVLFAERSFFGVLRVIEDPVRQSHVLQHGTTLHGRQDAVSSAACDPLTYYHREGPIGEVFAAVAPRARDIAVVGLGTGALACYAASGQRMTFFEIDPLVERVATNARLFTYIRNSGGAIDVAIGDGRKKLEEAATGTYDLIVIDAFSSDAVPVHLLTREALRMYMSRLRRGGVLAFHISNRYIDLETVLGATAAAEGFSGMANRDVRVRPEAQRAGRSPSHWVVISSSGPDLRALLPQPAWRTLRDNHAVRPWTDDFSNILDVLILRLQPASDGG